MFVECSWLQTFGFKLHGSVPQLVTYKICADLLLTCFLPTNMLSQKELPSPLPQELLDNIFRHVDDIGTVLSLRLVCNPPLFALLLSSQHLYNTRHVKRSMPSPHRFGCILREKFTQNQRIPARRNPLRTILPKNFDTGSSADIEPSKFGKRFQNHTCEHLNFCHSTLSSFLVVDGFYSGIAGVR